MTGTGRPRLPPLPGQTGPADRLIAHRGVPARFPELSAASLVAARDAGAPLVEIDARPTADGLLVVLHDETPARITGCRQPAATLDSRTLTSQSFLADEREKLLLLDEALALLVSDSSLDIELKPTRGVAAADLAERAVRALVRAGSPRNVIVTSEDPTILDAARGLAPELPLGLVFRLRDRSDPVAAASAVGAAVIVANRRRINAALIEAARGAGLEVWPYVAPDARACLRLIDAGCERVFVDDYPRLAHELQADGASPERCGPSAETPLVLALDLGSTTTRAALVEPGGRIVAERRVATPCHRDGPVVEHDPGDVLRATRAVIRDLADSHPEPVPRAAAIAGQRSTGLWTAAGEAASPAVSWADRRGAELVERLAPRAGEFERITGLPLDAAWTALKARALLGPGAIPAGWQLVPLTSWIASRLTGTGPDVDPTLANRMYLLDLAGGRWSETMLELFGLAEHHLPALRPTVRRRGALRWNGRDARVPLEVLIGDQPAAYVGMAGPTGKRLALNIGTAGFAMRARAPGTPKPPEARRSPLWTSARHPRPSVFLDELVVGRPAEFPSAGGGDEDGRALARSAALGERTAEPWAEGLADAVMRLRETGDGSVVLGGGMTKSPHFVAMIQNELKLPVSITPGHEVTLLGAARLACAASLLPWSTTRR